MVWVDKPPEDASPKQFFKAIFVCFSLLFQAELLFDKPHICVEGICFNDKKRKIQTYRFKLPLKKFTRLDECKARKEDATSKNVYFERKSLKVS